MIPYAPAKRLRAAALLSGGLFVMACGRDRGPMTPENRAPYASISADPYTLKTGAEHTTTFVLRARNSTDPDGDALTYAWDIPGGTFVDGTSASDERVRVTVTGAAPVTVTLTVSDPDRASDSESFTLELGTGLTRFHKDYIEALFIGSGPLAPSDGAIACMGETGRWASFPEGTDVQVVVGSTIDVSGTGEDTRKFLRDAIADIAYATDGYLDATYVQSDVPFPEPEDGQVVSWDHPDPRNTGCPFERGCTHSGWRAPFITLSWAQAVQKEDLQPADAIVHDVIGHGVMGLCHIDQASIGGNPVSLMSGGPGSFSGKIADKLSPDDLVATRAVYAAGLPAGARYEEFKAADLVN
jgi:hypothetical protein